MHQSIKSITQSINQSINDASTCINIHPSSIIIHHPSKSIKVNQDASMMHQHVYVYTCIHQSMMHHHASTSIHDASTCITIHHQSRLTDMHRGSILIQHVYVYTCIQSILMHHHASIMHPYPMHQHTSTSFISQTEFILMGMHVGCIKWQKVQAYA